MECNTKLKVKSCCPSDNETVEHSCSPRFWYHDRLLMITGAIVLAAYGVELFLSTDSARSTNGWFTFSASVYSLLNQMSLGILVGIIAVGILHQVPRPVVMSMLGQGNGIKGLLRATAAGVMLDLCSHGILLVGLKLYERGATLGQTIAFLVASPWNSISLTIILFQLIGLWWTLSFVLLSALLALSTGLVFEFLVERGYLPSNPNRTHSEEISDFRTEIVKLVRSSRITFSGIVNVLSQGAKDSVMIIKWLLVGVIMAALLRAVFSPEQYHAWFGPHAGGMVSTLIFATLFEACSEGSTPIAADILRLGRAPGNGFMFLMSGVATDYTELLGLKERTKSWKIALALPIITVPQTIVIAVILNFLG